MSTLNLAKVSYNWINVFTTNLEPFETMLEEMYVVKNRVMPNMAMSGTEAPPTY